MRLLPFLLFCLFLSALSATICRAHGVEGYIEERVGTCVKALYDDGEPMAYAAVEIKTEGAKLAFQIGRTDRNGYFMFRPDAPGRWQVTVNDGMGHRLPLTYEVAASKTQLKTSPTSRPVNAKLPRALKIITGLAIIFGISGFFYGWRARRAQIWS